MPGLIPRPTQSGNETTNMHNTRGYISYWRLIWPRKEKNLISKLQLCTWNCFLSSNFLLQRERQSNSKSKALSRTNTMASWLTGKQLCISVCWFVATIRQDGVVSILTGSTSLLHHWMLSEGKGESWYPWHLRERSSLSYKMTSQPTTYGYSLFVCVSSLSMNVWWFRQGSLHHQRITPSSVGTQSTTFSF